MFSLREKTGSFLQEEAPPAALAVHLIPLISMEASSAICILLAPGCDFPPLLVEIPATCDAADGACGVGCRYRQMTEEEEEGRRKNGSCDVSEVS